MKEEVKKIDDSEQNDWQPLETTPFDSDRVKVINCDTRDFCCGWMFEDDRGKKKPNLHKVKKHHEKFFMTLEEIREILLELREKTGGTEPTWRFLQFDDGTKKGLGGNWQFKYLRFYKTDWGWYCQPSNDMRIIKKEWLRLPINKRYLNAH